MKIALDYDNTYTLDPEVWDEFIVLMHMRGHEVRIVTARDERYDRNPQLNELETRMPIIWCRGVAKKLFCPRFADFTPDVYIDDSPENVNNNHTMTEEQLAKWREQRDRDTEETIHGLINAGEQE